MLIKPSVGLAIEDDEVKGFARTITEIEWLLLILVLIYLVAGGPSGESRAAIAMALCFFAKLESPGWQNQEVFCQSPRVCASSAEPAG